jgi:hypothetical protein
MVLHGCVNFAGSPTNMASDMDFETLKMIENGSLPYFTLSYENTPLLKEDDKLSKYYSVAYDIWFDDLVETYGNLNEILGSLQTKKIVNHEFISANRVPEDSEIAADVAAVEEAKAAEAKAAADLAAKLAKAQALANRLGTTIEAISEDEDDQSNAGLITSTLTAEELEAENAVKYVINDGTVVRVTYEDGTVFILNYNRFAVSVDGQTIDAVSYVKM